MVLLQYLKNNSWYVIQTHLLFAMNELKENSMILDWLQFFYVYVIPSNITKLYKHKVILWYTLGFYTTFIDFFLLSSLAVDFAYAPLVGGFVPFLKHSLQFTFKTLS